MLGMDKMMAQMVGMTPEQMREAASRVQTAVLEMAEKINAIETQQSAMMATLERIEANVRQPDNGGSPRVNRRNRGASNDAPGGDGNDGRNGHGG